jgi:aspartate/methionine/tyrosine aminotransferase
MIIAEASRLGETKTYYFAEKLAEIRKLNAAGQDIINLGIGSPDMEPHASVIKELQDTAAISSNHGYQAYRGIPELRQAFSQWYHKNYKIKLNGENEILPLMGSKEGIMHISMAFLNPGDQVLIPNPGYPAYGAISTICGAELMTYNLTEENNWLPDIDQIEAMDLSKVKILWINYPHMPTGANIDLELLSKLVMLAKKHQFLICHDNPYSFILNEKPLSIFQADVNKEVSLELSSLSKNYAMAGWRIGVLSGAEAYLNTVLKFKSNMDSGMFKPLQLAAVKALNLNKEWFVAMNKTYQERRNLVYTLLDLIGAKYQKDTAGLFVWAKIPSRFNNGIECADHYLYNNRVFITPGSIFGSEGEQYIRISLCQNKQFLQQAIERCK